MNIQELLKRREKLGKELAKLDIAIKAIQGICEHKWRANGHDSHKNYKICSICELEDWY